MIVHGHDITLDHEFCLEIMNCNFVMKIFLVSKSADQSRKRYVDAKYSFVKSPPELL